MLASEVVGWSTEALLLCAPASSEFFFAVAVDEDYEELWSLRMKLRLAHKDSSRQLEIRDRRPPIAIVQNDSETRGCSLAASSRGRSKRRLRRGSSKEEEKKKALPSK